MNNCNCIFNIGDEVITFEGERGTIVDICDCKHCRKRGFLEPVWEDEEGNRHWITKYDADYNFQYYYKIGDNRFSEFQKSRVERGIKQYESALAKLKRQLKLIEELEEV